MVALAVVVAVVGGIVFMRAESKPSYQPLFTNLQTARTPVPSRSSCTSQRSPTSWPTAGPPSWFRRRTSTRSGSPWPSRACPQSGNVGFSNLEKSGITTSEFVQQVEYQQALEGQLEQTIESIQGVQSAQVNLVVPQQSDFAIGTCRPTTASILVDLTPGTVLSSGQVQAIVHLAASSTPGLSASDVTVVDNHGDVLTAPGDADGTSGASDAQQTDSYDNSVATSFDVAPEPGRRDRERGSASERSARLQPDANDDERAPDQRGRSAGQRPPPGQTTSNSSYTGTGTPPAGVLGSTQPATTDGGNGTYTSTSSQITNAVGQVTQTVKQAPGQVQKTSVAVLLNSSAAHKINDATIRSLVVAAAGLNLSGGDQLVVSALPFAASNKQAAVAAAGAGHSQLMDRAAEVGGLILLIAAMVAATVWASRRRRPLYQEIPLGELPTASALPLEPGGVEVERDPTGELPVVGQAAALSFGPEAVLAQVNDFVTDRPAEAAALLRLWANDRADTPSQPKALPV